MDCERDESQEAFAGGGEENQMKVPVYSSTLTSDNPDAESTTVSRRKSAFITISTTWRKENKWFIPQSSIRAEKIKSYNAEKKVCEQQR